MSRAGHSIISIPPELLGLIIIKASLDEPSAPLRLAAVSRAFHRVTMSTPGAWTNLFLRVTSGTDSDMMATEDALWLAVQKAKMWLKRSGACSVDVSIEMGQALPPSTSVSGHPSSVNGLERGCEDEEDTVTREAWGMLLLPHVLSRFQHRIRSLKLFTITSEEAQTFFDAVYPSPPLEDEPYDFPLEGLTVVTAHDGLPHSRTARQTNRMPSLRVRLPSSSITSVLCRNNFPHLEHLKFVNLPLPLYPASVPSPTDDSSPSSLSPSPSPVPPLRHLLSPETGHRLRSLSIIYSLRFAPIPLPGLLEALRATPWLEKMEIDGRLILDEISNHQQGHGVPPMQGAASVSTPHSNDPSMPSSSPVHTYTPTTSALVSPLSVTSPSTGSSSTFPHTQSVAAPHAQSRPVLALPRLFFLTLKVNNLPAILSSLVLPSLRELRIEDMDSKRRVAAFETAEALRGLIVRANMPLDGLFTVEADESNQPRVGKEKAKDGLEVLDMCNIALRHPRGISGVPPCGGVSASHSGSHVVTRPHSTHPSRNEDDAAAVLWLWCFRRMVHLRELRVENMDLDVLLGYITPAILSACSLQNLRSHSASDNRFNSTQSELHRPEADVSYEEAMSVFEKDDVKLEIEVNVEPLPYLKRLILADHGLMPTWLGNAAGSESSASPLFGDISGANHTFTSASIRVFKARRPDVAVENASTRYTATPASATSQAVSSRARHHALYTGPVDYLSLYLQ